MEYDAGMVTCLSRQLVETFKAAWAQHCQAGDGGMSIADIETGFRELLRQTGAQALRLYLSSAGTPVTEIACECGGMLHYQRQRCATITRVFGEITYERAYYAGCTCGQGKAPLDEQYGLERGAVSSGLAALLGLAGVEFGFDKSRAWLERVLWFDVSENTVRSETQTLGALQAEREQALCQESRDAEYLQARLRDTAPRATRWYGSVDAAKVRIEPRARAGKKPHTPEDGRDMKVGCGYEAEAVPPAQRSVRQQDKFEREQVVQRAQNMRYYCDMMEAEAFGDLLWGMGCAMKAALASELVFVCDGATWIWNLVTFHYPKAVQLVDWYHAEDRLKRIGHAAFSTECERVQWSEQATTDLWAGRVASVIRACEQLASRCEEAQDAVTYFTNNRHRMRYDQFRTAGYVIGSGTLESGCKQIVTQRLKLPGAQWNVQGAVHTAKARAAWLSGDWDVLCAQRAALPSIA